MTVRVSEVMTCTQESLDAWQQSCWLQEASCNHEALSHLSGHATAWLLRAGCCRGSNKATRQMSEPAPARLLSHGVLKCALQRQVQTQVSFTELLMHSCCCC